MESPSTAPRFFIAHGDHDSWVPVAEVRDLVSHLSLRSPGPVWFAELPGAQHGFDALRSWRCAAVIEGVDAFFDHVRTLGPDRGSCTGGHR